MDELFYINKCLLLIEEKVQWGDRKYWTSEQFTALSKEIHSVSKILISIDTLKRLFGRIKTSNTYKPQLETKNALAIFLGYQSWNDYRVKSIKGLRAEPADFYNIESSQSPTKISESLVNETLATASVLPKSKSFFTHKIVVVLCCILLAIVSGYFLVKNKAWFSQKQLSEMPIVHFSAKQLNTAAPVAVVFNYDISNVKSDSVFIDFGDKYQELLSKEHHSVAHTYRTPFLARAKLIADGKVLSTVLCYVNSKGWYSTLKYTVQEHLKVEQFPASYRVEKENGHSIASFNKDLIKKSGEKFTITLRNFRDFNVSGDAMVFETRVINHGQPLEECIDNSLRLSFTNSDSKIKFMKAGCSPWAQLQFSDKLIEGKYDGLTGLGRDLSKWAVIRLEVRNKILSVLFNKKVVYKLAYTQPVGKLKGIILSFTGLAAVDYVKIFNADNKIVFNEEFE